MRRSGNEVRTRTAEFAGEWRDTLYEKGDTQSFYNDFFGVRPWAVARYEEHAAKLDERYGCIHPFGLGALTVDKEFDSETNPCR